MFFLALSLLLCRGSDSELVKKEKVVGEGEEFRQLAAAETVYTNAANEPFNLMP